jgi:hypothetical protein
MRVYTNLLSDARLKAIQAAQVLRSAASMQEDVAGRAKFAATILERSRAERELALQLPVVLVGLVKLEQIAAHFGVNKFVIHRELVGVESGSCCCVKFQFLETRESRLNQANRTTTTRHTQYFFIYKTSDIKKEEQQQQK